MQEGSLQKFKMGFELHKYNIYSVSLIEIMLCCISIANWKPGVQFFRLLLGKGYKKTVQEYFYLCFGHMIHQKGVEFHEDYESAIQKTLQPIVF